MTLELNCFVKQKGSNKWLPACKLPSGAFANPQGYLLKSPTEVRAVEHEVIIAEMASRGETLAEL